MVQPILSIKDKYFDQNSCLITKKIIPSQWHYQSKDLQQIQRFYEFILLDSSSRVVKHYKDRNNDSTITRSTIQIF